MQDGSYIYIYILYLQVYDIAFSRAGSGRDLFASVGADGSVRMFDLRCVERVKGNRLFIYLFIDIWC